MEVQQVFRPHSIRPKLSPFKPTPFQHVINNTINTISALTIIIAMHFHELFNREHPFFPVLNTRKQFGGDFIQLLVGQETETLS